MVLNRRIINVFRPILRDAIAAGLFFLISACSMPNDGKILDDSIIPESSKVTQTGVNLATLPPGELSAILNANGVQLDWRSFVSGFGPNTYSVYRSVSGANQFQLIGTTTYNTNQYAPFSQRFLATTYQDSAVTGGVEYDYYVTLLEANGILRKSKVVKVTPISPFRLLSAVQDQSYNVTFTWENAGGAASYRLVAGSSFQNYPTEFSDSTSPTTLSGLATGRTFFAVKATSDDGPYIYTYNTFTGSVTGNFTTSLDYSVNGKLLLKWTPSSDASNFKVLYGTSPGVYDQIYALSATSPLEIRGLTPLTTYYFRVVAEGGAISHESTNEVSFVYQIPVTLAWNFSSSTQYTYNAGIDFLTGNSCKLTPADHVDNDGTSTGFGAGTVSGIAVSSLSDGSTGLKLGYDGICNGTTSNCNEMNSTWTPKWSDIQAYWKFNEGAGLLSAADSSGNTHTLSATSVTFGNVGHHLGAATLNGTTGHLTAQDTTVGNFERTQPFTISAWVWRNVINQQHVIAGTNPYPATPNPGWNLQVNTDNLIHFTFNADSSINNELRVKGATYPVYNSKWYHVVVTYDGSSTAAGVKIYVNGLLNTSTVMSNSLSLSTLSADPLRIGTYPGMTGYFNGKIDEFAIWDTVLTPAEIDTIYERQSANYGGRFVSRVMDAGVGNTTAIWNSLSWLSTQPFGKELPDFNVATQNETTAEYSSIQTSSLMDGIVGLWHFNEPAGSTTAIDRSGKGHNGSIVAGVTMGTKGKFNTSATFPGAQGKGVNLGNPAELRLTKEMSIAAWVFPTTFSGSNFIRAGLGADAIYYFYPTAGGALALQQYASSGFVSVNTAGSAIVVGQWQHVAMTRDSTGTKVQFYVNGAPFGGQLTIAATTATVTSSIQIGANSSNSSQQFRGSMDEFAIWNRKLSAAEIQHLYMRGASRVKFQVRSCPTAACSSIPFQGPDGTKDSFFTEEYNHSVQAPTPGGLVLKTPVSISLPNFTSPVSTNRFFQYQAFLETETANAVMAPELRAVTVAPPHYSKSSPVVVGTTGMTFNTISSLSETLGAEGCTSGVTYNLGIGSTSPSTWYWWDASVNAGVGGWVTSNGTTAQSNSLSVINANLSSFHTDAGTGVLFFKAFLNSSGSTPCELDHLEANGFIY